MEAVSPMLSASEKPILNLLFNPAGSEPTLNNAVATEGAYTEQRSKWTSSLIPVLYGGTELCHAGVS